MKTVALDIGDQWTGTALSDALGMFARPYKTVTSQELLPFLRNLFFQEQISTIVVGHPKTMKGTISAQTSKVEEQFAELKEIFKDHIWVLWDERLTSKHAASLKKAKTKEDKIQSHSIAAAFILSSYLDYQYNQKNVDALI